MMGYIERDGPSMADLGSRIGRSRQSEDGEMEREHWSADYLQAMAALAPAAAISKRVGGGGCGLGQVDVCTLHLGSMRKSSRG